VIPSSPPAPRRVPPSKRRSSKALGFLVPVGVAGVFLALAVGPEGCKHGRNFIAHMHERRTKSKPNTDEYADNVHALVTSPQVAIMKWSNIADEQPVVEKFYDDRNWQLAWTRDGKPTAQALAMIELFKNAQLKGLVPEDYDASRWTQREQKLDQILASKDNSETSQTLIAQFDAAMSISVVRYLGDLHEGRINPESLNFDIDVPAKRAAFDVASFINDQLVDADDVPSTVAKVEPHNPMYAATEKALTQYLQLAKDEAASPQQPLPSIPATSKGLTVGSAYPALPQLLQRLQLEGDASTTTAPAVYDDAMSAAVKHYQARHGLVDDGKLGNPTIASLNEPFSERVQQIDNALEHWRWLPDDYVNPRILVNLPEFQLRAYDPDHSLAFKMRVVDGEAKGNHDTPVFVRTMKFLIFRPYWNVPVSIIKKELTPHIERSGVGYLADKGYEVTKNDGTIVTGYSASDIEHLRYNVRQKPGPQNSLGLVKFMFPNEYDVYMHSTPELPLFNLTRRDRSHGCVRLQHADQMAAWVLQGQGDWDADKINTAMNSGKDNSQVSLKTQLPVVITYLAATADEDGTMHFFDDIYGYDKELDAALAKGRPYPKDPVKINPKLTPGETE